MLRMLNLVVDSYLDLRKELSAELDRWQQELLAPAKGEADWGALMTARNALHMLQDLCEEQNDAMQEWLDGQREQPPPWMTQAERDSLLARARDVVEHIQRVVHHVNRMEQSAETAVQIHFSAMGNRTNDIMRTLTVLTAIFLPLNLVTGFFGMNFEGLPLIHSGDGVWMASGFMLVIAGSLGWFFWRKRYLSTSRHPR
jgi:Mg2+ and Co2+ transporter CorA